MLIQRRNPTFQLSDWRPLGAVDREFGTYFVGFLAAGLVPEAWKWPSVGRGIHEDGFSGLGGHARPASARFS